MSWIALLSDDNNINNKVNAIIKDLFEFEKENNLKDNYGIFSNEIGLAILSYYYFIHTGEDQYLFQSQRIFEKNIKYYKKKYFGYNLSTGITGLLWSLEIIKSNSNNNGLSKTDLSLIKFANRDIKKGEYDYLHNAMGVAFYFLNKDITDTHKSFLINFINELNYISNSNKNGSIFWSSFIDVDKKIKGINLGMAHGLSSIINFLCKSIKKDININISLVLLKGSVEFLLETYQNSNLKNTFFPGYINLDDNSYNEVNFGWCYGDISMAYSIYIASLTCNNKEWRMKSIDILKAIIYKKDIISKEIINPFFCHGSAGIAHLYNRIYNSTKIEIFKDSAIYWINNTLNYLKIENGICGYKSDMEDLSDLNNYIGLLKGVSGVGLTLLATISNNEPRWDSLFLLS